MSKELTQAQVDKYLKGGGLHCPYCGSENIEADSVDNDAGFIKQGTHCLACSACWIDSYELVSILPENGNDFIYAGLPAPAETATCDWVDGTPPKMYGEEWFIAETTYGDRVVLRALPEEWSYDYKTADETHIKADKIKRWMQFPDGMYLPYSAGPGWKLVKISDAPAETVNERMRTALQAVHDLPIELDTEGHAFRRVRCRSIFDLGAVVGQSLALADKGGAA